MDWLLYNVGTSITSQLCEERKKMEGTFAELLFLKVYDQIHNLQIFHKLFRQHLPNEIGSWQSPRRNSTQTRILNGQMVDGLKEAFQSITSGQSINRRSESKALQSMDMFNGCRSAFREWHDKITYSNEYATHRNEIGHGRLNETW